MIRHTVIGLVGALAGLSLALLLQSFGFPPLLAALSGVMVGMWMAIACAVFS